MQSKDTQLFMLNLERWRVEHNMPQQDVAEAIGMSYSNYKKLVLGQVDKISIDSLKAVYELTGQLCHMLMEYFEDDYLRLSKICRGMTEAELNLMLHVAQDLILFREGKMGVK